MPPAAGPEPARRACAEEAVRRFGYDAVGNQILSIDAREITTTRSFTARNQVAEVTEAAGTPEAATTHMTYTRTDRLATQSDPRNPAWLTLFEYSPCCDRLVKVTDPSGAVTRYQYDAVGNRLSEIRDLLAPAADGSTAVSTQWTYDLRNRVIAVANGVGETTTIVYDEDLTDGVGLDATYAAAGADLGFGPGHPGSAVAATDPAGGTHLEIRDNLGRTVRVVDANGHATSTRYDLVAGGLLVTEHIDAVDGIVRQEQDGAGRVIRVIDAEGAPTTMAYDANHNRTQMQDAAGVGMTCSFDARNREVLCTDTRGDVLVERRTVYDANSNVIAVQDALGVWEYSVYDARNRRIEHTDRIGAVTRFAYDAASNLLAIEDAEGGITDYTYDERNLLVEERFPTGQQGRTVRSYGYDATRRLLSRTVTTDSASGLTEVTQYGYDAASRLLVRGYQDGLKDTFAYDPASRLTVATSGRYQNQVEREYDIGGRLIGEWLIGQGNSALPGAWSVWYGYDAANRVRTLTYPNGTEVTREYTARHQLEAVTHGGTAVANRTYDAAGKLTQTVLGNGLIETRDYVPGSYLVETIDVPGVTEFGYAYDANGRKAQEANGILPSQTQAFGYDAQDRLTSWSRDAGVVPAQTQSWNLSLVGDWNSTTRDGIVETRQHTDVHEVMRIKVVNGPNRNLRYDGKGNLIKDDANRRYAWDPENRLQTARTPKAVSPTGQNLRSAYVYDALGRRVAKTVNGRVTRFIHAGAQVIQEEDGQAVAPPAERASDGDVADLAEEPASGGILPASSDPLAPVLRVNFQPRTTVIPPGFLADKGKTFGARTNGLSYGWSASLQNPDRIQRFAASLEEWDTFLRAARPGRPQRTWRMALPNGTYPVIVVAGDAVSRNHTNHLIIGGIPVSDPDPATMDTGYELGDFDGYAVQATVTDGVLTIAPGVGAFDPTVCFIEIGPEGTTITPDVEARLADVVESMTTATYAPQAPSLARRQYVYGDYVDELLSYTVGGGSSPTRYFTHANHLYSIAATTNSAGAVVGRYAYDAYGTQTVTNAAGTVTLAESGVSQTRGFTGYIADMETGLYHARARQYESRLGRFIGRDDLEYIDGMSMYAGYFIPSGVDPSGKNVTKSYTINEMDRSGGRVPGVSPIAESIVALEVDTSSCMWMGVEGQNVPCPSERPTEYHACSGTVPIRVTWSWRALTGELTHLGSVPDGFAPGAPGAGMFGTSAAGVTTSARAIRSAPPASATDARGLTASISGSVGEVPCQGGSASGVLAIGLWRPGGVIPGSQRWEIVWNVRIEECGRVTLEDIELRNSAGSPYSPPVLNP